MTDEEFEAIAERNLERTPEPLRRTDLYEAVEDINTLLSEVQRLRETGVIIEGPHDEKSEIYDSFYDCPKCNQDEIRWLSSYCQSCGLKLEWQKVKAS